MTSTKAIETTHKNNTITVTLLAEDGASIRRSIMPTAMRALEKYVSKNKLGWKEVESEIKEPVRAGGRMFTQNIVFINYA